MLATANVPTPSPRRLRTLPPRAEMQRAMLSGNAAYDGIFVVAVKTTGIFCLPSCRPPRRARPENVEFFATTGEALAAGYRPCKLCRPLELAGRTPAWIEPLLTEIARVHPQRITAADLRRLDLSPERVRRWFFQRYGLSFAAWCRRRRLSLARTRLRDGATLDEVALDFGYESHSGFRAAFAEAFGQPPGRSRQAACIVTAVLDSPLGRLLVGATDEGVCLVEYADRRTLGSKLAAAARHFAAPVVPGEHPLVAQLADELAAYFAGRRTEFTVPVAPRGTPFQRQVWRALGDVPFGTTICYQQLAQRIGRPTAVRAVASANGQNRVNILIPCHRVVGKRGALVGYGGGLWRKRLLLELEQRARRP